MCGLTFAEKFAGCILDRKHCLDFRRLVVGTLPNREWVYIYIYIYYRFIVRFPIGLDFLFIIFLLNFFRSWTSSLSISSSAISASTLSNHVFLGLPTGLLPSTLYSIHTYFLHPLLITCPYHLSLPPPIKYYENKKLRPTTSAGNPSRWCSPEHWTVTVPLLGLLQKRH